MSSITTNELEDAFEAAGKLPEAAQKALAEEIMGRVRDLTGGALTPDQRDEVRRRLSEPPRYADPEIVKAFFARHGVEE